MNSSSSSSSDNPTLYNFQDNFNLLAAVMILMVGVFGVICNGSIIYIFYKESSERTAFNLICVSRALISTYILITSFLLVFLISTLLGSSVFPDFIDSFFINSSLTFYIGNEYQVAIIAVNRFTSLFFPFFYSKYFNIKPTLAILIGFYGYRIFESFRLSLFLLPPKCYTLFVPEDLTWTFNFEDRCSFENGAFNGALAIFSSMTLLNVITFCRILWFYKLQSSQNQSKETKKRAKKNALLFCQTVLQDSLYLIDLTFTYKLSSLSTHRFWSFISGTFVWECLHSLDGFIMLMFNERLSLLKKRLTSPSQTSMAGPQTIQSTTMNQVRPRLSSVV